MVVFIEAYLKYHGYENVAIEMKPNRLNWLCENQGNHLHIKKLWKDENSDLNVKDVDQV